VTDLPANAIDAPKEYFPATFVSMIAKALDDLLPDDCVVVERPLGESDPNYAVGVYAESWATDEDTYQIGQFEPTENRYEIRVQSLVKSIDHMTGRAAHSNLAKTIRVILYRDTTLRVRLTTATEELLSSVERVKGYGVKRQEFLSGKVGAGFMFMATTHVFVDTNTTFL